MINENILDDNLESIDKIFVRTRHIQQVEKVAIVGCIVIIVQHTWSIIGMMNGFGISFLMGFLMGFLMNFVPLGTLLWWRNLSIKYDKNLSIRQIELPLLLVLAIICMLICGLFILYSFIQFLFDYITIPMDSQWAFYSPNGSNLSFMVLEMFSDCIIAFLYIYYWWITKKSMNFINKKINFRLT